MLGDGWWEMGVGGWVVGDGWLEVDVSITKKSVASRCRAGYCERPSNRSLYLLLELKHYSGNASTSVATSYIGRCAKLHVRNRPEALVLSHGMTPASRDHVTSEGYHVYERLTPLKADARNVRRFQTDLANWLRQAL